MHGQHLESVGRNGMNDQGVTPTPVMCCFFAVYAALVGGSAEAEWTKSCLDTA